MLRSIPPQTAPFLALACAGNGVCFRDLLDYLRGCNDLMLQYIAKHIADNEFDLMWAVNCFELELGISPLEWSKGPSWWVTDVLPAVKAEMDRRSRPKLTYTGNSPIAKLKQLDLAAVAAQYTDLSHSGPSRLKGKCPLHDEKTPSFVIYEDSQRWQCFGACSTGGDVINLLQLLKSRKKKLG